MIEKILVEISRLFFDFSPYKDLKCSYIGQPIAILLFFFHQKRNGKFLNISILSGIDVATPNSFNVK